MQGLKRLLAQRDNRVCADCGAADPKWASANLGVFVCIQCSGIHRSLGVHISKVMSTSLDEWTDEQVSVMAEVGGNAAANAIYEAHLPAGSRKPCPDSTMEERREWIVRKYEYQDFVKPTLRLNSTNHSSHYRQSFRQEEERPSSTSRRSSMRHLLSRKKTSKNSPSKSAAMVEFLGLLKVRVVKGTNLAVRDILTSDPYVVLNLGHQTAKTKVVNSNLNPVWDEEIMLSVPSGPPVPLKLQVFDYDKFSADDIMGEVEVDLQPIVAAASVLEEAMEDQIDDPGEVQIGRCLATAENALVSDSVIRLVGGQIKQDLAVKLQNVESGEVQLELEWVPLAQ
ncbi:ADP-ribosylation factor GTPase-activating protein AGD12 isoform X1 [Selaginella moellendorffii]|uniref:ADP-ribosylation factor GTPase-activating protein AGD12 isoform X1 n=3 Tax=Selaginella moellendorffii TaxID=88036 RepID=UPI000D1D0F51|nr:ADP-ribosylation factor GTPase-activating protein AGD12 isoform X1 [Selaginella moellendorffii]|eukprot:XP_024528246.1 ADP-ribosylation factor GTPase-activating protein AGD12 isoform X1 [Selaginella moellendorffii]